MKIGHILKETNFSISFEFFPPKTPKGEEELFNTIKKLEHIKPTFVSVTYGAGGSTRERTQRVVTRIHRETEITVMAHLTCIAHTRDELKEILDYYKNEGIENILALRGDPPKEGFVKKGCNHSTELIDLIRSLYNNHFSIGVASYPEGHPESPNMEWEIRFFKLKVEKGAEFSITQMFFDNEYFYRFREKLGKAGINIPVIPGIMPITNFGQIVKFASMCGATIPQSLIDRLERVKDDNKAVTDIGVEFAIKQCEDLIRNGVKGFHFYTLNKSDATLRIYSAIKSLIDR